jgi:hypothetical protein
MTAPDAMDPTELTKKLKGARKRIRQLESALGSEQEARKALEAKVDKLATTQVTLMFNLRRAFKQLGLKPERPKK